ncbi:serine/threonine-protein kinase [Streptomyces sp. SBT349]|uniref:serine/threonine-protein kinase n=1 Tax=Streptomyces sp. SBT349 TaxID=1580539 RepID=UPI00066E86B4|nr:serine/threonine-protein kinase [Streptomyces sp. SBT349]
MTACNRPGCGGTLSPTGYCDTCGRRPRLTAEAPRDPDPETGSTGPAPPSSTTGDGEMSLPRVSVRDPSDLVIDASREPVGPRHCGVNGCWQMVGMPHGDQPAAATGECPRCHHPYSFEPQLHPGELLAGQYEVVGCVAHGGFGWVYLARDLNLDGSPVALKGLINNNDATALSVAAAERRFLTSLQHDHIVGIRNFVTWRDTGYIVMEFISGHPLDALLSRAAQERILGGPLLLEHVAVYGCRILNALEYLHQHRLLYCDMKPSNVIHHEDRITIIDLGAVRRVDDRTSPVIYTDEYLPYSELHPDEPGATSEPESVRLGRRRPAARFSRMTDLYTVATTLRELAGAGEDTDGVGADAFRLVLDRATAVDRAARFTSAAEMFEQLRGVWRQLRAEAGDQQIAQSAVFAPGAALLDDGLGAPPPLRHWLRPPGREPAPLDPGRPAPARVGAGLPAPVPHPDHPRAARELQVCDTALAIGEAGAAQAALERACDLLTPEPARYDWRVAWYCGRLLLARGASSSADAEVHAALAPRLGLRRSRPRAARDWFTAVYRALPGEPVPKLALGYCAELDGEPEEAEALYRAVWRRDHADGSAAFGLARIHLAGGDRAAARAVLDQVPTHAPHHQAARVAATRLLVARLPGRPLAAEDFAEAQHRLPGLPLDRGREDGEERLRLTAELRESALRWALAHGWPPPGLQGGPLFGTPPDEEGLRALLEASFTALAPRAATTEEHHHLIDHANDVRPLTLL